MDDYSDSDKKKVFVYLPFANAKKTLQVDKKNQTKPYEASHPIKTTIIV